MTKVDIKQIKDEFQALKRAYSKEEATKRQIDAGVPNQSFEAATEPIQGRLPLLNDFVGGLATVFPGTSSVESDFSILKWSKDEFSMSLTNFSLEGVLHAKQFSILRQCCDITKTQKFKIAKDQ